MYNVTYVEKFEIRVRKILSRKIRKIFQNISLDEIFNFR